MFLSQAKCQVLSVLSKSSGSSAETPGLQVPELVEDVSAKMKTNGVYVMAQLKAYGDNISLKIIWVWK